MSSLENNTDRIWVEDALKHLYHCGRRGQTATIASVAGVLELRTPEATELCGHLQTAGLAFFKGGALGLTQQGQAYALQVVRAHRLYETYLAQETGRKEADWHRQAEIHEHRLAPAEVQALARKLGNPTFDPHGDPIPSAEGKVPPFRGAPLSDWQVGEWAKIVHIEDEPETVYAQLVALGAFPGLPVRVLESSPHRLLVELEGRQHVLAPVVAANLSVVALERGAASAVSPSRPLSELRRGEKARVLGISPRCRGAERRRLLDLGIVPDTLVEAEFRSPTGDPTAYRVRQTLVALRREQADLVQVGPKEEVLT